MSYRLTTKRRFSNSIVRSFVYVCIMFAVAMVGLYIIRPIAFLSFVGQVNFLHETIAQHRALLGNNRELEETIQTLQRENQTLQTRKNFEQDVVGMTRLGDMYGDVEQGTTTGDIFDGQQVSIMLSPPQVPYDTYILNGGSDSNIRDSVMVIADGLVTVGYVDFVTSRASRVRLFSHPAQETPVRIGDVFYSAYGQGGGTMFVRLPRSYANTQGQSVYLAGARNALIGQIVATTFDPQDSYVSGYVTLGANIYEQSEVLVTDTLLPNPQALQEEIQQQEELLGIEKNETETDQDS